MWPKALELVTAASEGLALSLERVCVPLETSPALPVQLQTVGINLQVLACSISNSGQQACDRGHSIAVLV